MDDSMPRFRRPANEPVLAYAPGSPERAQLKAALARMRNEQVEFGSRIAGAEVRGEQPLELVCPHEHRRVLGRCHMGGARETLQAIEAALAARQRWAATPWQERAAIFLRAAELLAGAYRPVLNAATMLNQSKTAHQAEIDSACELIDFWRFNVWYMTQIYAEQPSSPPGVINRLDYRPLEGFVFAVSPFNFTSIQANLPTAPALMGNTVVWKPAPNAMLAPYYIMRLLEEAGLPPGVINMVAGDPAAAGEAALSHPELAGVHFTGSVSTFRRIWKAVGANIERYRSVPRVVAETGGKDFIIAHPSADLQALHTAIIRGGYEYQGQKCSAVSRVYVPRSLWPELRERLVATIGEIRMGDVTDFTNFMGAVIDARAFAKIRGYLEHARSQSCYRVLAGGGADDRIGWFVEPTLIETTDPGGRLMCEEIFGPVVTVYAYEDTDWLGALELCERTSPYGLTGAVFARDRAALQTASAVLRYAAGNFYINDKPTGAVVDQQPFGGARHSGTDDKAGSAHNLRRWVIPRAIKEALAPPLDWRYPFMQEA